MPSKEELAELNKDSEINAPSKKPSSSKLEATKGKEKKDDSTKKPSYIRNTNWTVNSENKSEAEPAEASPKSPHRSRGRTERSQTAVTPSDKAKAHEAVTTVSTGRGSFVRPRTQSIAVLYLLQIAYLDLTDSPYLTYLAFPSHTLPYLPDVRSFCNMKGRKSLSQLQLSPQKMLRLQPRRTLSALA